MTKKQYAEKRTDPQWQKLRLQIFDRDGWKCTNCGDGGNMLAVHHAYYIKGRDPWMYPLWSMRTLCNECHKAAAEEESIGQCDFEFLIAGILGDKADEHAALWPLAMSCAVVGSNHGTQRMRELVELASVPIEELERRRATRG